LGDKVNSRTASSLEHNTAILTFVVGLASLGRDEDADTANASSTNMPMQRGYTCATTAEQGSPSAGPCVHKGRGTQRHGRRDRQAEGTAEVQRFAEDEIARSQAELILRIMYCYDEAADCPEHTIFEAADIPEPFAIRYLPNRAGRDKKVHKTQQTCIEGQHCKNESDSDNGLDDTGGIHPGGGRMKPRRLEKAESLRHEKLRVNMRNEEESAD
jgi:hypothetical protein